MQLGRLFTTCNWEWSEHYVSRWRGWYRSGVQQEVQMKEYSLFCAMNSCYNRLIVIYKVFIWLFFRYMSLCRQVYRRSRLSGFQVGRANRWSRCCCSSRGCREGRALSAPLRAARQPPSRSPHRFLAPPNDTTPASVSGKTTEVMIRDWKVSVRDWGANRGKRGRIETKIHQIDDKNNYYHQQWRDVFILWSLTIIILTQRFLKCESRPAKVMDECQGSWFRLRCHAKRSLSPSWFPFSSRCVTSLVSITVTWDSWLNILTLWKSI